MSPLCGTGGSGGYYIAGKAHKGNIKGTLREKDEVNLT